MEMRPHEYISMQEDGEERSSCFEREARNLFQSGTTFEEICQKYGPSDVEEIIKKHMEMFD